MGEEEDEGGGVLGWGDVEKERRGVVVILVEEWNSR